jgi:hypothetical protein
MDDETNDADVERIGRLVGDESVGVRRAACLALCRIGTPDIIPHLLDALDDGDWQVRFHAATALEAITGCVPGSADDQDKRTFFIALVDRLGGVEGVKSAIGRGPQAVPVRASPGDKVERQRRWYEAAGRLGSAAPETARVIVRQALAVPLPPPVRFEPWAGKRHPLEGTAPDRAAIRAAGRMRDEACVPLLVPWLSRHEYPHHATQAAVALGQIGTPEAVNALWESLRKQVPDLKPFENRYLQRGPRPEEYAVMRGLILADAVIKLKDVSLIIAMLPGSFLEKPRYEDRLRPESQRVLLGRMLLEKAGWRQPIVKILVDLLAQRTLDVNDPLYRQVLNGINLERPFAEHRRPFPVVDHIEPEHALWFLSCLAIDRGEVPEPLIVPYLTSSNWRERIDAAVLLGLLGFGDLAAETLFREASKPYPFGEIMGIGKSHYDTNFRDKCYLVAALAHHAGNVDQLNTFADPKSRYRDIRYGLAVGLGRRGQADGAPLLVQLATTDPISVIRRQARQSIRDLQERLRFAGHAMPRFETGRVKPFEAWYTPRTLDWPGAVVVPRSNAELPPIRNVGDLKQCVAAGLEPANYRDLNNSNNQAPGAKRLMIRNIHPFARAAMLSRNHDPEITMPMLQQMIDSPYPFAQFLALRELARLRADGVDELLIAQLERFADASDTVRFYWTCEALAERNVHAALPALARFACIENPAVLHGPLGMGRGYPAAKALGRIVGRIDDEQVQRLLRHENIWLRAGILAGLTESKAPGIKQLLSQVLEESSSGIVHSHARTGLAQLSRATGSSRDGTPTAKERTNPIILPYVILQ